MKQLLVERAKRERELELLRHSEPAITAELADLRGKMARMRGEMEAFGDIDRMRREHDATMQRLGELKQTYIKRRDTMRQQVRRTAPASCLPVCRFLPVLRPRSLHRCLRSDPGRVRGVRGPEEDAGRPRDRQGDRGDREAPQGTHCTILVTMLVLD